MNILTYTNILTSQTYYRLSNFQHPLVLTSEKSRACVFSPEEIRAHLQVERKGVETFFLLSSVKV